MSERTHKKRGLYRGILAGGLVVALFGAGFMAVNHYMVAAAHGKPVKLQTSWQRTEPGEAGADSQTAGHGAADPQTAGGVKADSETAGGVKADSQIAGDVKTDPQPSGYVKADFKVEEDPLNHVSNPNAISAGEAADTGARYLWDVFGVDLTGCTLNMFYTVDPSRAIGYWYGDVTQEGGDPKTPPYSFSIEAVSGEPDSIIRRDYPVKGRETVPYLKEKADAYYRENLKEYDELAKTYAAKLLPSKPAKAEFMGTGALIAPGYDYEIPQDAALTSRPEENAGDPDVTLIPWGEEIPASYVYVTFLVTDAEGGQAQVQIDGADKSLVSIENRYDGVDYDPGSVG